MLAIYHLRLKEVDKAKNILNRFWKIIWLSRQNELEKFFRVKSLIHLIKEVAIATLTGFHDFTIDQDEVEREARRMIQTLSDDEIYADSRQAFTSVNKRFDLCSGMIIL